MRWLSLIFSFLAGRWNGARAPGLQETMSFLFAEAALRSRKPAVLVLGGLTCVLILCGGFFLSLIDLTTQIDREGTLSMTAQTLAGLALVLLSASVFYWIFNHAWPGLKSNSKPKDLPSPAPASSLEQALSLLVMDFVKERQLKREEHHHASPPKEKESPTAQFNN